MTLRFLILLLETTLELKSTTNMSLFYMPTLVNLQ
ncbi:uncharacterized protein METZ01_LOCUS374053 [marine metagenome]|uniref:Uncharacterized protein n=1 Tax=marine metagenome TaxID=408172 RepID=A0A382TGF1_9ZZZZ